MYPCIWNQIEFKTKRSFAWIYQSRSSCSDTLDWIVVFKNLAEFTAKHPCWSLFLKKLKASGLQLCSKETPAEVFSCELCEIFQHTFFTENSEQLLLSAVVFNLQTNYYSSERIFLEEQLVDSSHDLLWFNFFSYCVWVCVLKFRV